MNNWLKCVIHDWNGMCNRDKGNEWNKDKGKFFTLTSNNNENELNINNLNLSPENAILDIKIPSLPGSTWLKRTIKILDITFKNIDFSNWL